MVAEARRAGLSEALRAELERAASLNCFGMFSRARTRDVSQGVSVG